MQQRHVRRWGPVQYINYSGGSGGMESTAGADMIMELAKDAADTGIWLQQYITDLDAKTAAAVRAHEAAATIYGTIV